MNPIYINGFAISIDDDNHFTVDGKRVKPEYDNIEAIAKACGREKLKTSDLMLEALSREKAEKQPIQDLKIFNE